MPFETISVIGLGYIGLPTAAMFASRKKRVIGIDLNQQTVDTINQGKIHIVEPELDIIVHAAVTEGYLKAAVEPEPANAFLIAVPTPFKKNGSTVPEPDLRFIESAVRSIAPVLKKGDLVILESTSPVGTTEQMAGWLAQARPDLSFPQQVGELADINIAYCPERVLPGHIVRELVENDRVIGGITPRCSERAIALYKTFVQGECVTTNARTAEMVKLTENSCRDVQIAFANELSIICDKFNINVWELIALANRHPRINILQPGPGVGGHCIAVDPWFIVSSAKQEARLIKMARSVNDLKPDWVLKKVRLLISDFLLSNPNKTVKDIVITCYGITFKPNIDDCRESPSLSIVENLLTFGVGKILIVEPNIGHLPASLSAAEKVDVEVGFRDGNIHLLLVKHKQFAVLEKPKSYVIDTVGLWN